MVSFQENRKIKGPMKRLQPTTSAALSLAHLSLQRESKKDFRLTQRMTSSRVVKTSTDNNSATVLKQHSRRQSNTTAKCGRSKKTMAIVIQAPLYLQKRGWNGRLVVLIVLERLTDSEDALGLDFMYCLYPFSAICWREVWEQNTKQKFAFEKQEQPQNTRPLLYSWSGILWRRGISI